MTGLDGEVTLRRGPLFGFAAGSLGMGVWVTVPGLLLLYFLTDVLAVAPWLAGLTLLLPKIADVVLHPWVGHRSDVEQARRGHRRRLLLAGCLLPLAFAGLFAVPGGLTGAAAAGWVALLFIAGNLLFAAYQVPYLATPADLRIGYHERTRLMAFRMMVLTVGILLSGLLAPLLTGGDTPTRGGYLRMALLLGAGTLAAMLVGVGGIDRLRRAAAAPAAAHATGGWPALAASLRDRQFRWLVAAYLAMSTTTHLVLAGVPYYARYELGRPKLTTVLVAAFVAPALLVTPAWLAVARRVGKQRALLAGQLAFAAGALVLAVGRPAGLPVLITAVAVLGTAFAGMQLLPFSMLPDVIRAAGAARAGTYTGVWTATEATGGALGPYAYALCLAAGGFVASAAGETVTQSPAAHAAIRYGFGLLPAAVMLVAVLMQRRYTLDRVARAESAAAH
ncbi:MULTISPECIES: MFS transporter [Micromonospora]|uniref:MFS transporter n=1 Tax=Micromonospora solifontis TaxID=2487138 RepID=A0ABX9WMV3_9ACTN|nr:MULTISPECIES: MFS transporter [Micromonospora]NES13615.1 MFS transporter [Micromonospora sp. PPF5-17B]NES35424.1 MFS transporter [Micromonospora solifontis]NES55419.1 MFS transporter [Micromonospora sp. PPF5-6]RNM00679.1 MFS transporter [Micromonospora solifontis]